MKRWLPELRHVLPEPLVRGVAPAHTILDRSLGQRRLDCVLLVVAGDFARMMQQVLRARLKGPVLGVWQAGKAAMQPCLSLLIHSPTPS